MTTTATHMRALADLAALELPAVVAATSTPGLEAMAERMEKTARGADPVTGLVLAGQAAVARAELGRRP